MSIKGQFLIGTSGWIYPHWKGTFHPKNLSQNRYFEYYATKFNCVEINATFYRAFADETYLKWREQAPNGFEFLSNCSFAQTKAFPWMNFFFEFFL
jgi:uncharacterized protein YecE (DUF72 family)